MSQTGKTNPKKKQNKRWKTALLCGLLLICCVGLILFESYDLHILLGLNRLRLWETIVLPFSNMVKSSFIDLYVSQVSTTFLVTAILSMLSNKENPIYWTTALEHRLVHPKGSGIKDIALYSFCTLAISLVAMIYGTRLCFFFFFLLNIYLLVVITWRMIMAFYDTGKIKEELRQEFAKFDEEQKEEKLLQMEERMTRAANESDMTYLRDCEEFLVDIAPIGAMKALRETEKQIKKRIDHLYRLAAECDSFSANSLEDGEAFLKRACSDGKRLIEELIGQFKTVNTATSKNEKTYLEDYRLTNDPVDQQIKNFGRWAKFTADRACYRTWAGLEINRIKQIDNMSYIQNVLHYVELVPGKFSGLKLGALSALFCIYEMPWLKPEEVVERRKEQWQYLAQSIREPHILGASGFKWMLPIQLNLLDLLKNRMSEHHTLWALDMLLATRWSDLENQLVLETGKNLSDFEPNLDFHRYFSELFSLLRQAYDNHWALDPYLKSIVSLRTLIVRGLCQIYGEDSEGKPYLRESDLPRDIAQKVTFFRNADEAKELLLECTKDVLVNDACVAYEFSEMVCFYLHNELKESVVVVRDELTRALRDAVWTGDDYEYILSLL